jgi:hypothetical protein
MQIPERVFTRIPQIQVRSEGDLTSERWESNPLEEFALAHPARYK